MRIYTITMNDKPQVEVQGTSHYDALQRYLKANGLFYRCVTTNNPSLAQCCVTGSKATHFYILHEKQ